jgi:hypothetical protein
MSQTLSDRANLLQGLISPQYSISVFNMSFNTQPQLHYAEKQMVNLQKLDLLTHRKQVSINATI